MPKVDLTDRFCGGAKPARGQGRTSYFDARTPGLELLVSSTGHKSWQFHFESPRNGKRARRTLGTYPAMTLAKARREAIAARQLVEDGNDPRKTGGAAELTFSGLVRLYLADADKARLRSINWIKYRLEKDALPIIGDVKLAALVRRDLRDVVDRIGKRGAVRQAFLTWKDMQAVLRWGVRREYLERNPMDGMERPAGSTPRERVLSDDEIKMLWNALPGILARSDQCQNIIRLCLITGQRVGEICGMARSELDMSRGMWSLPGSRTKNAHAHNVPLSGMALKIIREAVGTAGEDAEYLFRGEDGEALDSHVVTRAITRARETGRSPIAEWTAHDLRRTALTGMAKLGIPPHVIAHVANHRSVTKGTVTTAHYLAYSYESEKRAALDLWADRLGAIASGNPASVLTLKTEAVG